MFGWLRKRLEPPKSLPAGTWVTCEKHNHRVCQLAMRVTCGEDMLPEHLKSWLQPEPAVSAVFPLRCYCGSSYMATKPIIGGIYIHIKKLGWWPDVQRP